MTRVDPLSSHVVELAVERLAWRGRGVARPEGGPVVLIAPGVLPGERIAARITARKKDYWEARAEAILEASPYRRPHPCPYAPACGGSPFGVLDPEAALAIKADMVRHTLVRSLGQRGQDLAARLAVVPSPRPWGYRFRGQVEVRDGQTHLHAPGCRGLVPIESCLLFAPPLNDALPDLARRLPPGRFTVAASPVDGAALAHTDPGTIAVELPRCGVVRIPPGVFFQANQFLNPTLVEMVIGWVSDARRAVDLFAGAGNFALPLAASGCQVLAVEGAGAGVAAGEANARHLGLAGRLRWAVADLHRGLPLEVASFAPEAVVVDPPRVGARGLGMSLAAIPSIRRVVWISCDVVNSLRDVDSLLAQGFEMEHIALVDMFPGTWHMEVVMVCRRHPLE